MAKGGINTRDWRAFTRDLDACIDAKTINQHLAEHHGKEIVNAVIGSAKAGIGPGDKPYDPYAPSYEKQIAKQGGQKLWLRGLGRGGRAAGMLDPKRFSFEVSKGTSWGGKAGVLYLVWIAATSEMAIYGAVHQGSERGGQTHTKGHVPPRPWLHFENRANEAAVVKGYELTMDELVAQFNANRRPK